MTKTNPSDLVKQPVVVGVAALIVGLLLGLLYAWVLDPIKIVDTDFSTLRSDLKQQYVRMVAEAYSLDTDARKADKAAERIAALGPRWAEAVAETASSADGPAALQLTSLKQALDAAVQAGTMPAAPASTGGGGGLMGLLLPLAAACLVVIVIGGAGFYFLRSRTSGGSFNLGRPAARPVAEPVAEAAEGMAESAPAAMPAPGGAQPIQRFLSTYTLGDDVYDDSFSVDGPDGNFLGECGMGISETIGVGDPKKVTAFEVWLFDKNDIRTVTKVIMSEHAFRDEALKSRLAAKGEPVQAAAGDTVSLETATLIVTARIVDMAYGGGALPAGSFFERMTVELQAYRKPAAA
ncbi:MAG: hypothetical protein JNK29_17630 [Anaerolineales bacterium]|nr:hypothetical protein [Anaerolineales bacterium]